MPAFARIVVGLLVLLHLVIFVFEAMLWLSPAVYALALPKLNPGLEHPLAQQAQVLRALFINQGTYNLLVAAGAALGLILVGRQRREAGLALIRFTATIAMCAGIVLAMSTVAYGLATAQAAVGSLTLVAFRPRTR